MDQLSWREVHEGALESPHEVGQADAVAGKILGSMQAVLSASRMQLLCHCPCRGELLSHVSYIHESCMLLQCTPLNPLIGQAGLQWNLWLACPVPDLGE